MVRGFTILGVAIGSCALPGAEKTVGATGAGQGGASSVASSASTGGGGGGGGANGGGSGCFAEFGEPELVSSLTVFTDVALRSDGLAAWVSEVDTGQMKSSVHRVVRTSETFAFDAVREQHPELTDVGAINVVSFVSDDERGVYLTTDRNALPAPGSAWDIWRATRNSSSGAFSTLSPALATAFYEFSAHEGTDGWLYGVTNFGVANADDLDIWRAAIESPGMLGPPSDVQGINTSERELSPILDASGLRIFFAAERASGKGGADVWTACRREVGDPFSGDVLVEAAASSQDDAPRLLSPTGRLYIRRGTMFAAELYVAEPLHR